MKIRNWSCLVIVTLNACSTQPPSTHWPEAMRPDQAALFTHNEIEIDAPCERVWSRLIAAPEWPSWYSNASNVKLANSARALAKGQRFQWTTFELAVQSEVRQFEPPSRLSWTGQANGITGYHTWDLRPLRNEGCRVITEETNNGPLALALRHKQPDAIHDGHATWLKQLKTNCEAERQP